jgi:hypothetical protein
VEENMREYKGHRFGRIPSAFDSEDYSLSNFIPKLRISPVLEKKWDFPFKALDQKETGHCVGFSMADFGINHPTCSPYTNEDGHNFYYLCKENDGEPLNEEGTSIRSAAQVLRNLGKIENYAFALKLSDIQYWLLNKSPMIVGTTWTEAMSTPNKDNVIGVTGEEIGGHAYLINEWTKDGYIGIQNSWGADWGDNGKAYISVDDFEKIFKYSGEAIAAVEVEGTSGSIVIPKKSCWLLDLFK